MLKPLALPFLLSTLLLAWMGLMVLSCTAKLEEVSLDCDSDACACGLPSPSDDTDRPPRHDVARPDTDSSPCHACLEPGLTLRFSDLTVTEPRVDGRTALPDFLNRIWRADVCAHRLNIMLQVREVTENPDGSREVLFAAGSGWHGFYEDGTLVPHELEDVLEPANCDETDPAVTIPDAYYFVEGFTTELRILVNTDCSFETIEPGDLNFHPGPIGTALICSGGDPDIGLPRDTIPIRQLTASGQLNDTCTRISDADLQGCIAQDAACKICSFALAPDYATWSYVPDESKEPVNCQASYCQRWCGAAAWTNFGGFVSTIRLDLACAADGGATNNGYQIAGFWEGEAVSFQEP